MHRALQLLELINPVFEHLDDHAAFSCALVCKFWSDVSLDVLWKELDSPKPLFSLLSPLRPIDESPATPIDESPATPIDEAREEYDLEFERPIRSEDWETFYRYAGRVKTIKLEVFTYPRLSASIYSEVAYKRPTLALLPSLTRLHFEPQNSDEFMLPLLCMNESVEELRFSYPAVEVVEGLSDDNVAYFFKQCVIRAPNLKIFELCTSSTIWSVVAIQEHVVDFVSHMTRLEVFNCSIYFAIPTIITALSRLPSLRVITFEKTSKLQIGQPGDVLAFRPSLRQGAFDALVDLSFCATFQDAILFMAMRFAPELMMLRIHSPQTESSDALQHIILSLSQNRKSLTKLCLSSIATPVSEPLRNENGLEIDLVTVQILTPLTDFPALTHFEVDYHRSFQLSNTDLEHLIAKWDGLKVFCLCSDPILKDPPTLTLKALPIIARCCPELHSLSLYLDTHLPEDFSPASNTAHFGSLVRIRFGTSGLAEEDVTGFALFLSELLPEACKLDSLFGPNWLLESEFDRIRFQRDTKDVAHWEKMLWVLKLLMQSRKRDKTCIRKLERKAKDLTERIVALESSVSRSVDGHIN